MRSEVSEREREIEKERLRERVRVNTVTQYTILLSTVLTL